MPNTSSCNWLCIIDFSCVLRSWTTGLYERSDNYVRRLSTVYLHGGKFANVIVWTHIFCIWDSLSVVVFFCCVTNYQKFSGLNCLLSHCCLCWKARWAWLNSQHRVSLGWHQVLSSPGSIWRLWRRTCSQAHSGCLLNSVPCSCGTEVPDSLLSPSSKGPSASWHRVPSIFKVSKGLSISQCFKSLPPLFLSPAGGSSLLLRVHMITLGDLDSPRYSSSL